MSDFQAVQRSLTAFVRDPMASTGPAGIEARRLNIYRDLFFNNIEGFLSNGFPVCRSLYSDTDWEALVRDFMAVHYCNSPYFLQIAEEFLDYLSNQRHGHSEDPSFLFPLAHYEWVELALDVADADLPAQMAVPEDLLTASLTVSPLAWSLAYEYPVQLIGRDSQPSEPSAELNFIVVYRQRSDEVKFLEINAATARLLALIDEAEQTTSAELVLHQLAEEMQMPKETTLSFGRGIIEQLFSLEILIANAQGEGI
jgi:hypothetical protein